MSRSRKTLTILVVILTALTFSSCSWFGDDDKDKDDNIQSTIYIDATSGDVADQNVTIELGELDTWMLKTEVSYPGDSCINVSMATRRIDDPDAAQKLNLGDGLNDTACSIFDDAQTKSFTSLLVAGEYYVVINGSPTSVIISINKDGSGGADVSTDDPDATTTTEDG